jgi:uncharacterized protein YndB with AHSA1/START domain
MESVSHAYLPVHGPTWPGLADPLLERHLYAENRSARTVTTYLIAVRQADTFLRERGTSLEAATRGDLEAFLGDLLARRKASTAATYHKVLKILYGWLAEEEEIPANRRQHRARQVLSRGRRVPARPRHHGRALRGRTTAPGARHRRAGELGDPAAGFTVTRVLPGDPGRVFAHFVEPEAFSRWFVVDGYTTPAARVALDVRPGGTINAVLVPEQGGPEVPFAASYGTVDPPRTVQLAFTDPTELVTITLLDLGDAGTQLTYRNQGAPLRERAQALAGVARMLDALEASVAGSRTGGG